MNHKYLKALCRNTPKPAQYSQDSQSDSNHEFEVTAVKPNTKSTRLDGIHSCPQDSHALYHTRQRTNDMDQHGHQGTPGDQQGPYTGHSQSPASQEDKIRHLQGELDQARRDARSMSNNIRELVAGIRDLPSTLIQNSNSSMNTTLNNSNRRHQLSISVLNNIDTYDGKQGHKLDDWLADIENAATLVEENEVMVAKGKARGLARDLIKEHEDKPWPHIKEQLHNCLNNASIHTYIVIRNSHSSWSVPIIVVLKGDGGKCLVIDYRALNKVMRKFIWPMPKVEDIFSQLNGAKYFSTLDLRAGYHHIRLTADSIPKTAFTSLFGKYEYVKVPFGLAQAPAYFQELMTGVLRDLPFAMAYLDNIIIYSPTPEEHLQHIKTVFEKLHHAKLSMKLSKCHFFTKEIQYLGHILGVEGIRPVPAKTEAIKATHPPVNPKQVCAFLGLVGYYRKFIKNFAKIAKPLTVLTRMDVKFKRKETHSCASMKLKDAIIQAPILRYLDTAKPYIMYTDTSNDACRAQLSQMHEEVKFPVAFLSHTFTDTQRRWGTPEQEAYGIYFAIKK